jgi:cyanate permease
MEQAENHDAMAERKNSFRWVVLALLFLNTFFVFLATYSIPPLLKEIGEEIPLTKAGMGMIMGMITIPSLFFSLIGGGITDKVGARYAFGVAVLIVGIAGAFRSIAGSAYALEVCMLFIGLGMATLGPIFPKALAMWFPPKEFAMANGICMVSMPLALTLAMGSAAGILSPVFGGWRNVMAVLGVANGITAILWIVLFREGRLHEESREGKQSILENFKKVFRVKDIWWASVFYSLNMIGVMSIFTLLPQSLSERGMTTAMAGIFVAILTGTNSVFKVVGGTLSDRTGKRKPFLFISSILLGLSILGFSSFTGIPLIVALVIGGAAMGTISPIFMAILVETKGIGAALAGTTVGLIFMVGNVFGFVGPVVSGKLMDVTGAQWPGFLFMGLAYILASFFILPVRETGKGRAGKSGEGG